MRLGSGRGVARRGRLGLVNDCLAQRNVAVSSFLRKRPGAMWVPSQWRGKERGSRDL